MLKHVAKVGGGVGRLGGGLEFVHGVGFVRRADGQQTYLLATAPSLYGCFHKLEIPFRVFIQEVSYYLGSLLGPLFFLQIPYQSPVK